MGKYDDIINLPHHVSPTRPHMSVRDRAAQFAPFAALTGYGDAIDETARLTGKKIELDDEKKRAIELRLIAAFENSDVSPTVTVTHFRPDEKKTGGEYVKTVGKIKKIDETEKTVLMSDGKKISIDDISDVESDIFHLLGLD